MFAGFDFKIDSQENLINFSDYVIQGKNHLDTSTVCLLLSALSILPFNLFYPAVIEYFLFPITKHKTGRAVI